MNTVEPVFGTLINFLGLQKVNTLGQAQAHKCMLIAATAYNLKKLLKYAKKPIKVIANHLELPASTTEKAWSGFYAQFDFITRLLRPSRLMFKKNVL
jgi:hypothetical protein